jgi:hypothetical protein
MLGLAADLFYEGGKPGNDAGGYRVTCADTASHLPFCRAQQSV